MNKELGDPGKAGMPRNEEEKKEGRKVGGSVLDLRAVPGEVWWSCGSPEPLLLIGGVLHLLLTASLS